MNNFTVKADGTAKVTVTDSYVNMGSDNHSIFSNGGTALVIHAKADDMKSDPSGNAGDRIACGEITKSDRDVSGVRHPVATVSARGGAALDLASKLQSRI
jgi:hypothetical protein